MSSVDLSPIFSPMSSDPNMADLVEEFVGQLRSRISSLEVAYAAADPESLARVAHQLKGASGGYGFDEIGEAAARLEHDRALQNVVIGMLKDHTELFKQFQDNPSFKKWLADTIFGATYEATPA